MRYRETKPQRRVQGKPRAVISGKALVMGEVTQNQQCVFAFPTYCRHHCPALVPVPNDRLYGTATIGCRNAAGGDVCFAILYP